MSRNIYNNNCNCEYILPFIITIVARVKPKNPTCPKNNCIFIFLTYQLSEVFFLSLSLKSNRPIITHYDNFLTFFGVHIHESYRHHKHADHNATGCHHTNVQRYANRRSNISIIIIFK